MSTRAAWWAEGGSCRQKRGGASRHAEGWGWCHQHTGAAPHLPGRRASAVRASVAIAPVGAGSRWSPGARSRLCRS